jgi:hypothetical protein
VVTYIPLLFISNQRFVGKLYSVKQNDFHLVTFALPL